MLCITLEISYSKSVTYIIRIRKDFLKGLFGIILILKFYIISILMCYQKTKNRPLARICVKHKQTN